MKLENVLFVPSLKCNLIYLSQLIDQVYYIDYFTKNFCLMHRRTSRMIIDVSE